MATDSSHRHATVALLDDDLLQSPACPMCHTSTTLTQGAIEAGGDWQCTRCGQRWNAARLEAVAAYDAWTAEHDAPIGRDSSRT